MRSVPIPAIFACVEHPTAGLILYDTGYAEYFLKETDNLPNRLYRWITPVVYHQTDSAVHSLQQAGLRAEDVRAIIISHFHADHIAGLRDFPNAEIYYTQEAYDAVKNLRGLRALRAAYLPGLLPPDFAERSKVIQTDRRIPLPHRSGIASAIDIFGDGSILGVELSGHAIGQIGLLLCTEEHDYLLCADAAWSSRAYRENRQPHPVTGLIVPDRRKYADSFSKLVRLHKQYPALRIVPSHCPEVWERWTKGGGPL